MPTDRRRRSRSRSRKKTARQRSPSRSSSPPPAKQQKGGSSKEKRPEKKEERGGREEKNSGRKAAPPPKAVAAAAAEESDEDDDEEEEGGGKFAWQDEEDAEEQAGVSLEAKVALLEVEVATLKAENRELKNKLVEALRGPSASQAAAKRRKAAVASKPGQPPPAPEPEPAQPAPVPAAAAADPRRARLAAAEAEAPSERAQARRRPREEAVDPPKPAEGGDDGGDDPMHQNAVMLCNNAMEAYNESVPNNIPPEKRLPLVQGKLERFLGNFADRIQILDLKSGGAVIKDRKLFTMRYSCVFRESGAKLKVSVHKRFYFDASGGKPTYCLDFETHESLVTATPGTPQDGKLGVRDPRTEHLAVLYEEKGGKLCRMWLRQDAERLGLDPTAGEDILTRTDCYKAFEAKIAECKGGKAGEFYFFNYHDTPTVG